MIPWVSEQLSLLDYGINLRYKYTIYVRYISSQETRRFGNSSLDQWTMVFFIYIVYLTLNNSYELLDSFFSAQPNIKQNVKLKPRGDSTKDLYMYCIQTLTLKTIHPEDISSFSFSLKVTIFTRCILLRKE